jgi:topoisomerase IA-like protein
LGTYVQPSTLSEGVAQNQSTAQNQAENQTQTTSQTQSTSPEDNAPIYEKTFEYGRYVYCQQVVKDYENRYSNR